MTMEAAAELYRSDRGTAAFTDIALALQQPGCRAPLRDETAMNNITKANR